MQLHNPFSVYIKSAFRDRSLPRSVGLLYPGVVDTNTCWNTQACLPLLLISHQDGLTLQTASSRAHQPLTGLGARQPDCLIPSRYFPQEGEACVGHAIQQRAVGDSFSQSFFKLCLLPRLSANMGDSSHWVVKRLKYYMYLFQQFRGWCPLFLQPFQNQKYTSKGAEIILDSVFIVHCMLQLLASIVTTNVPMDRKLICPTALYPENIHPLLQRPRTVKFLPPPTFCPTLLLSNWLIFTA